VPVPDPRTDNDAIAALKEWAGAFVGESGQREKANDQKREGFGIIERCVARDVAADKASAKRWYEFWK
jgi:hypothetical protein